MARKNWGWAIRLAGSFWVIMDHSWVIAPFWEQNWFTREQTTTMDTK